jgi:hypothetical protein
MLGLIKLGIPIGVLLSYQLNPTAWNWGGYTGFFWCRQRPRCLSGCTSGSPSASPGPSESWVSQKVKTHGALPENGN